MHNHAVLLILAAACFGVVSADQADNLSPILLIPGISRSQLNARDSSEGNCNTNNASVTVWLNVTHIVAKPECFRNQVVLNYSNGSYSDTADIKVTVANFGSTSSVEYIDVNAASPYFFAFVEHFVRHGYTRDVNIRAAPYDYRLAPEQLTERGYFADLKQLIQTMYEENGNTKVTIVVHSMGGPVSLYFLTRIVSQDWKDTYIHSYIPLAGAWSGGSGIISDLLSGPLNNSFLGTHVGVTETRTIYRSYPSFYFLLPRTCAFNDTILVSTQERNYTASDYLQLFIDAGYPQGYTQYTEIPMEYPAPNVPTYCFYGLGSDTPLSFIYNSRLDVEPTNFISGDGDGTVNRESAEVCLRWANSRHSFRSKVFTGVRHNDMIVNDMILQDIEGIVGVAEDPTSSAYLLSTINYSTMLISVMFVTFYSMY